MIAQQYERNLYIVEKYFQRAIIPPLTIRAYNLHLFSRCCLPKCEVAQNSSKISTHSTSRSSKVIDVVNGPYLLDNLMIKLRLPVVLYVSFAVGS